MASFQIHRAVFASTATARFLPRMAKLKCQAFQTRFDEYSPCLRHGFGYIHRNTSQIRFMKSTVRSSSLTGRVVGPEVGSCLCRPAAFGSRSHNIVQLPSRFWFMNPDMFVNTSRYMPHVGGGATFSTYHAGAVFKRPFSTNVKPRSLKVNAFKPFMKEGVKNGSRHEKSGAFSTHQKQAKSLSAQSGFSPRVSPSSDSKNSNEVLVEGGKEESCQSGIKNTDSSTLKKKRQSQSKKKKEDLSSTSSASNSKSPKRGLCSTATVDKSNKNKELLLTAENNSSANAIEKVDDAPGLPKESNKKTTKTPRRKGKSLKKADPPTGINGSSPEPKGNLKQASSSSNSLQTPVPQTSGKIKQHVGKTWEPLYPPRGKSVVVVESLTKAKVIQGYLGDMYEVLPSYGHIRDLAARSGSVRPDDDFSMVWEVPSPAWTHIKSIKVAITGADNLILASDPDREGEAIAWHILEMLHQQDALHKDLTVARVVFQEITQSAIKSALQSPRDIDENLVHAYLARRALDYLIGFNISPLLWRKLPGCQSAGRVQSAALSLICDRETEIIQFKPQEYWTVDALFKPSEAGNHLIQAHLTHFDSKKLNQLSVGSEAEAKTIEQTVSTSSFKIIGSKRSKINKNPPTPYITSTLQQDAANKLNFTAAHTMKLAQKLYEGVPLSSDKEEGLITYMRTDGVHLSDEAVQNIRSMITDRYGQMFISANPRKYFKKVKNSQEAHEAIRPTDIRRLPSVLVGKVDEDCLKLYTLIWSRTMACQMEPAKVDLIQVDIGDYKESIVFRAACSRVAFLGYRAVYEDKETRAIKGGEDETKDLDKGIKALSDLKIGDHIDLGKMELLQHHTQHPPRYSEASLVKKLEELGIGRPSTYAAILKVLQARKYVTIKSRVLYPEFRGRMVSAFISHYFSEVTDYSFTADMETELDNVSAGMTEWKGLLKDYWTRFSSYCDRAGKVHIHHVEKMIERTLGDSLFSNLPDQSRTCPSCLEGILIFKVSRFGAGYFIGCDQHPRCKHIAKTLYGGEEDDDVPEPGKSVEEPKLLGVHPVSSEKVLLKNGPYGSYVQLGEDRKGYTPKRSSLSQFKDPNAITLDEALDLLRYPITLGNHPKDGQPVVLKIAKTGFTIRYRRNFAQVPKNVKPSTVTLEEALELLKGQVTQTGRPKKKKPQEEAAL